MNRKLNVNKTIYRIQIKTPIDRQLEEYPSRLKMTKEALNNPLQRIMKLGSSS